MSASTSPKHSTAAARKRSQLRTAQYMSERKLRDGDADRAGSGGAGKDADRPSVVRIQNPIAHTAVGPEAGGDRDGDVTTADLEEDTERVPVSSVIARAAGPVHGWRHKLHHLMETNAFQLTVIALILIDLVVVLLQIAIDLEALNVTTEHEVNGILHYISLVILCLFVAEVLAHIVAVGICQWIRLKWDVFDGVVVLVSFIADIALSGAAATASILIVLRLWRVTRVIHGAVHTAHLNAEARVKKWKLRLRECEKKLEEETRRREALEREVKALRGGRGASAPAPKLAAATAAGFSRPAKAPVSRPAGSAAAPVRPDL